MKAFSSSGTITTHILQFDEGDYLLECITDYLAKQRITAGAIVSGVGTLDQATLHMITTTTYPPELTFPRWGHKPLELVSMQGAIAAGVPHIHAMLSTDEKAIGGHLEGKCRVFYLAEVVILAFGGLDLDRVDNDKDILKIVAKS